MPTDPIIWEWLVGTVFIVTYAYRRYNTPGKRYNTRHYVDIKEYWGSTTFFRFWGFFLLYALTLFAIYWWFGSLVQTSPELVGLVVPEGIVGGLRELASPIAAALVLTTLVLTLPWLRTADEWLLEKFWNFGNIPKYVYNQSKKLWRGSIDPPQEWRNQIRRRAESFNIRPDNLVFEESSSLDHEWLKLCSLMVQLEGWVRSSDPKYARFIKQNEDDFEYLKEDFIDISNRFSTYLQRCAKSVTNGSGSREDTHQLLEDIRQQNLKTTNTRLKRTCIFIARGVLASEITERRRRQQFENMGFQQDEGVTESLRLSQHVILAFWVALAFLTISLIQEYGRNQGQFQLGDILFVTAIMTTSYGLAAIAAIFPKSVWQFADIEHKGARPVAAYVFSGVIAVILGLFAMISIRYTFNAITGLVPGENFREVIASLMWSYPYLLQSVAIGIGTAYLADNFSRLRAAEPAWFRWVEAFSLAIALMAATALTYGLMEGFGPFEGTRDPDHRDQTDVVVFVLKGGAVGLVIGFLAPYWYRKNRSRTPIQRLIDFVAQQETDLGSYHKSDSGIR